MKIVNDILGWGLLLLGIWLIFVMINSAANQQILLSLALSIPSTMVFRAGVGFLRMNTAYRMAQKSETENRPGL
jgi:multisubunit Na+/H+ antiporter MnhG subunit